MECAAAEQSVPVPATSQAAQCLLEQGIRLPKVAKTNLVSRGGRGQTDGPRASCCSQPWGSCQRTYGCPVATHGVQGPPCSLCYGAESTSSFYVHPCRVSACEENWTSLLSSLQMPPFTKQSMIQGPG